MTAPSAAPASGAAAPFAFAAFAPGFGVGFEAGALGPGLLGLGLGEAHGVSDGATPVTMSETHCRHVNSTSGSAAAGLPMKRPAAAAAASRCASSAAAAFAAAAPAALSHAACRYTEQQRHSRTGPPPFSAAELHRAHLGGGGGGGRKMTGRRPPAGTGGGWRDAV